MGNGKFIVFEGLDGSGITTQASMLRDHLENKGWTPFLTKEPTDGPAGSILRMVLAGRITGIARSSEAVPFDPYAMALLFAADRFDHLRVDILPKLENGVLVISDRYYLSSFAYQSLDLDLDWLLQVNSRCPVPDLTILFDVPPLICKRRMEKQRWHVELYEEIPKLEKIRQNYIDAADRLRKDYSARIEVIDGNRPMELVHRDVVRLASSLLQPSRAPKDRDENQARLDLA